MTLRQRFACHVTTAGSDCIALMPHINTNLSHYEHERIAVACAISVEFFVSGGVFCRATVYMLLRPERRERRISL